MSSPSSRTQPGSSPSSRMQPGLGVGRVPEELGFTNLLKSSLAGTMIKQLEEKADDIYRNKLIPINEKMMGPLPEAETFTSRPMVLLLGNHSSGKSSFVNHLMESKIQSCGVAPTDDCFTLITSGPDDTDQDGQALVGNKKLGFSALQSFGQMLISHTHLKVRKEMKLKNVILVDSPGMIDSAATQRTALANASSDRGYDFMKVIRWFAEHSDVILLFFDPEKPGTTGETLDCLTTSLAGLEHKLSVVFNKCDQFVKMHDFARAYGALCWNLSKVIPRKDLPPIYTMCIPVASRGAGLWKEAMDDLNATRKEVINKVYAAQERRVDNMISRLDESTRVLAMYSNICSRVRKTVAEVWWRVHLEYTLLALGLTGVAALLYSKKTEVVERFGANFQHAYLSVFAGGQSIGLGYYFLRAPAIQRKEVEMRQEERLNEVFTLAYPKELAEGDEYLRSIWARVLPRVTLAMKTIGIFKIGHADKRDNETLQSILRDDVVSLRDLFAREIGDASGTFVPDAEAAR